MKAKTGRGQKGLEKYGRAHTIKEIIEKVVVNYLVRCFITLS